MEEENKVNYDTGTLETVESQEGMISDQEFETSKIKESDLESLDTNLVLDFDEPEEVAIDDLEWDEEFDEELDDEEDVDFDLELDDEVDYFNDSYSELDKVYDYTSTFSEDLSEIETFKLPSLMVESKVEENFLNDSSSWPEKVDSLVNRKNQIVKRLNDLIADDEIKMSIRSHVDYKDYINRDLPKELPTFVEVGKTMKEIVDSLINGDSQTLVQKLEKEIQLFIETSSASEETIKKINNAIENFETRETVSIQEAQRQIKELARLEKEAKVKSEEMSVLLIEQTVYFDKIEKLLNKLTDDVRIKL